MNTTATRMMGYCVTAMQSLVFLLGSAFAADPGPAPQILTDSGVKGVDRGPTSQ